MKRLVMTEHLYMVYEHTYEHGMSISLCDKLDKRFRKK